MRRRSPSHPRVARVRQHAALAPVVALAFHELAVSAALWSDGEWSAIHSVPGVIDFELENDKGAARWAYNARCFERVLADRRVLVAEHAGFWDVFVPVGDRRRPEAVLVSGPVARARPDAAGILGRWRSLTCADAQPADGRLLRYVSRVLEVLTLPGESFDVFVRFLTCFADLMGGHGSAEAIAREAVGLHATLMEARYAERAWAGARSMLDDASAGRWGTLANANELTALGLDRPPDDAVVGLLCGSGPHVTPVDDLLRRDRFMRDAVAAARRLGGMVAGRIGNHGVALLISARARRRSALGDLALRLASTAEAHGLKLHVGWSGAHAEGTLIDRYHAALGAAEMALSRGLATALSEPAPRARARVLADLRRRLAQLAEEPSAPLAARFDEYMEAVAAYCGYQLEPTRAHLEAGFGQLLDTLSTVAALEPKDLGDVSSSLERRASGAESVAALLAAYRQAMSEIGRAMASPHEAQRALRVRRASAFIGRHLGRRLSLDQVARVAGLAPGYFSKLLKREQGVGFELYVRERRIERARELLADPSVPIDKISARCGFGTRNYFHDAFREAAGTTPARYRRRVILDRAKQVLSTTTESIERVAQISGYRSVEALERAFREQLGTTPLAYRSRGHRR